MNFFDTIPGSDLVRILINYLGLPDYLKAIEYELMDHIRSTVIHGNHRQLGTGQIIPGEQIFWGNIFSGSILEGQKVELNDFYLSSWFPRKPGLYWTYDAMLARNKAENHIIHKDKKVVIYSSYGKTLMTEIGGVGTVNFQKGRHINLLTATSTGETHSGIPLVVNQKVWSKISSAFIKHQFIKASMKGTLISLPTTHNSFFLRSPNLPKVAVLINNPQLIDISSGDRSYLITPWTIFERKPGSIEGPYGFTYTTCDMKDGKLDDCIEWMKGNIKDNSGKNIITDFDEEKNQLNAIFPINDMVNNPAVTKDLIEYCQNIPQKFKNY